MLTASVAAGTHRYSRENLVSSRLLCSHLNSRGQLPSAMHVRTRRFPSRWTWLRTGSVLKYGETSSAERGGRGGENHALPHRQDPPAPPHQDRSTTGRTITQQHTGRGMAAAACLSPCPSQGPQTPPRAIFSPQAIPRAS